MTVYESTTTLLQLLLVCMIIFRISSLSSTLKKRVFPLSQLLTVREYTGCESINTYSLSPLGDSYSKPRVSVLDSPIVNAGENVTFQYISWQKYDGFILAKEGEPKFSRTLDSQYIGICKSFFWWVL